MTTALRRDTYLTHDSVIPRLKMGSDGLPPLRLVPTERGLDFALPSGEVIDYRYFREDLRDLWIHTFVVKGVWAHEDPKKPFRFRVGQRIETEREPDNEYDKNAVGITIGRPRVQVGYVQAGNAYRVAYQLDYGQRLEGIIFDARSQGYPKALLTTRTILQHLLRP